MPGNITIAFPEGKEKLMHFEITIRPDEGIYRCAAGLGGPFWWPGLGWGACKHCLPTWQCHAPCASAFPRLHHIHTHCPLCRGGKFLFDFNIPTGYPHEAPKVLCKTKVGGALFPDPSMAGVYCQATHAEQWDGRRQWAKRVEEH